MIENFSISVYLYATQDILGAGGFKASTRLLNILLSKGIVCRLKVGIKNSDLASIDGPPDKLRKALGLARPSLGTAIMRMQKTTYSVPHSPAILPSGLIRKINSCSADVINLHWICGEFLSITDIAHIRKPTVWTLHDMWPFCGAEHYAPDDASARWRQGYTRHNRPEGHGGLDIDRWTWNRKRRAWRKTMHIVTPSRWLADCVRCSALMGNWPVTTIPNPLDTRQFQPWSKNLARDILNLPQSAPLVLFGAIGGGRDPRKGWDYLQAALPRITRERSGVQGVIFGQSEPANPPKLGLPLHWLGHLHDDATLALVYSAADVMVVPSRQETFGQTASEAQACGCPVVAFNCTGLPDVVEHTVTGYLAQPYEPEDLANGIRWVLEDPERHARLSAAARERAVRLWSPEVVVPQYLEVYRQAIEQNSSSQKEGS